MQKTAVAALTKKLADLLQASENPNQLFCNIVDETYKPKKADIDVDAYPVHSSTPPDMDRCATSLFERASADGKLDRLKAAIDKYPDVT